MTDFTRENDGGREKAWYDLFSRGARDWLRHNDKVRAAVKAHLPELVANMDIRGASDNKSVKVPVKFLEHFRFQLLEEKRGEGVGQGVAKPGDIYKTGPPDQGGEPGKGEGGGGNQEGGLQFVIELKISDIIDWLWEELELPHLEMKSGGMKKDEYIREGWDRRGARSRLDRRRTLKEAIKRRAAHTGMPPIINEDLRFRQLVRREQPSAEAVVFFCLDASSSMAERDRKMAKSFFFWALQGLRRQYQQVEMVFIAHTVKAWEFSEDEFFKVTATGGTIASTAFSLASSIIKEKYDPGRYNIYLFYASDGENFPDDTEAATKELSAIASVANFVGYLEILFSSHTGRTSVMTEVVRNVAEHLPVADYPIKDEDDVWNAIRAFFNSQAAAALE